MNNLDFSEEKQLVKKGINGFLKKLYEVSIAPSYNVSKEQFIFLMRFFKIPEKLLAILITVKVASMEHNSPPSEFYNMFLHNYFEDSQFPRSGDDLPYPATLGDYLGGFLEPLGDAFGEAIFEELWLHIDQSLTFFIKIENAFSKTDYGEIYHKLIDKE